MNDARRLTCCACQPARRFLNRIFIEHGQLLAKRPLHGQIFRLFLSNRLTSSNKAIPKLCAAKLLLCPAIVRQALGQPQSIGNDRFDPAQALSESRLQRIHIDGFDALGMAVLAVLATASLGSSDLDPVGSLIAGARKPVDLHEALNKPWTVALKEHRPDNLIGSSRIIDLPSGLQRSSGR